MNQYVLLNNAAQGVVDALWSPYLTHGSPLNWARLSSGGLFHTILAGAARTFGFPTIFGANFWFQAGIFLDKLVLLSGLWLLSGRYVRSGAAKAVGTLVGLGAYFWTTQIFLNMQAVQSAPLMLYFLHRFVRGGGLVYLFALANFFTLQLLTTLSYVHPFTALLLFLYGAALLVCTRSGARPALFARLRAPRFWLGAGLSLAPLGLAFVWLTTLKRGMELTILHSTGRAADKSITLEAFLQYGGNLGPTKWLELLAGTPFDPDLSLYIGLLPLVCVVLALLTAPRRRLLPLYGLLAFIVAFSFGGLIASWTWMVWPGMRWFRHIGSTAQTAVIPLAILGAVGFERALLKSRKKGGERLWALAALMFSVLAAGLFWAADVVGPVRDEVARRIPSIPLIPSLHGVTSQGIWRTGFFATALAAMFWLLAFTRKRTLRRSLLALVLCLGAADMVSAGFYKARFFTNTFDKDTRILDAFTPYTVRERRLESHFGVPRFDQGARFINPRFLWYGQVDDFFMVDQAGAAPWRYDQWQKPLDNLIRVFFLDIQYGTLVRDFRRRNQLFEQMALNATASRVMGVSAPKVRFFTKAAQFAQEEALALAMKSPRFHGDELFVFDPTRTLKPDLAAVERDLSGTEIAPPHVYEFFGPETVGLTVHNEAKEPIWMSYADVWHPFWRVEIDGAPQPLYRSWLAYKAVRVPPGLHQVRFVYEDRVNRWMLGIIEAHAAASVFAYGVWAWIGLRGRRGAARGKTTTA